MRAFEIGVVLGSWRSTADGSTVPWTEIRDLALCAESMGCDTVWSPDELIGRIAAGGPRFGFWDGVAIPAALAAATSRIKIGTWVMSSLHRNPGSRRRRLRPSTRSAAGDSSSGSAPAIPGAAPRALGSPRTMSTSGSRRHRDRRPAPARRAGGLRGDLPRCPRPDPGARGSAPRSVPDPAGRSRPEGLPPRRPSRRHLELLRRGAERRGRARAEGRRLRSRLRRGRTGPGDDRPLGGGRGRARSNPPAPAGCSGR